jgi:membrane associated rhomboid family serine protease
MKYLFITVFVLVYIFGDLSLGYSTGSAWWTHLSYPFQHAGAVHLAINCVSFLGMWFALRPYLKWYRFIPAAYIISVAVSFIPLCVFDKPTVGASAMIYAISGAYISFLLGIKMNKNICTYLCCIVIALSVSFFRENSNFPLHLFSLIAGILWTAFINHHSQYPVLRR